MSSDTKASDVLVAGAERLVRLMVPELQRTWWADKVATDPGIKGLVELAEAASDSVDFDIVQVNDYARAALRLWEHGE